MQFVHAGTAESPEGKADVIEVNGEGNFTAKLFVDEQTHLPLMLSWMDKEPLQMTMGAEPRGRGGRAAPRLGGGGATCRYSGGGGAVRAAASG